MSNTYTWKQLLEQPDLTLRQLDAEWYILGNTTKPATITEFDELDDNEKESETDARAIYYRTLKDVKKLKIVNLTFATAKMNILFKPRMHVWFE